MPQHFKIILLFILGLLLLGNLSGPEILYAQSIEQTQQALLEAEEKIQSSNTEHLQLESSYLTILKKIEHLKSSRGTVDLLKDYKLKKALKEARQKAEDLNLHSLESKQEKLQQQTLYQALLSAYEREIHSLETVLLQAPQEQLQGILLRLEELQLKRATLLVKAPKVQPAPDLSGFDSDDPDELFAAAEELKEHETRLQKELKEVEGKLGKLERQRLLASIHEDSTDEDLLFVEEQTSLRLIASRIRPGKEARSNTRETPEAVADSTNGSTSTEGSRGENNSTNNTAEQFNEVPASDPSDAPSAGEDIDGGIEGDDTPNIPPEQVGTPIGEPSMIPITSPTTEGIIRIEADPRVTAVPISIGARQQPLKSEIQTLRQKQKKLRHSLERLGGQERAIRQRMSDLLP